jgi:hypothetical protein
MNKRHLGVIAVLTIGFVVSLAACVTYVVIGSASASTPTLTDVEVTEFSVTFETHAEYDRLLPATANVTFPNVGVSAAHNDPMWATNGMPTDPPVYASVADYQKIAYRRALARLADDIQIGLDEPAITVGRTGMWRGREVRVATVAQLRDRCDHSGWELSEADPDGWVIGGRCEFRIEQIIAGTDTHTVLVRS